MRYAIGMVAVVGSVLLWADDAPACSCIQPPPPVEARDAATAVFEAEVTKAETAGDPPMVRATMRVLRAWKGVSSPEIAVMTATDSAACGLSLGEGSRWLIYAEEHEGALHAGLCSRSTQSDAAAADFTALGAPSFTPGDSAPAPTGGPDIAPPAPPSPPPATPEAGGCAGCSASGRADASGLGWGLLLALWWRRRSRGQRTPRAL